MATKTRRPPKKVQTIGVTATVSKAPFEWAELLSEMQKVAPSSGGQTIEEIAAALKIGENRARKMVKQGLESGRIERLTEVRITCSGFPRTTIVFRVKGD